MMTENQPNLLKDFIKVLIKDCIEDDNPFQLTEIHIIKYIYLLDYYTAKETGKTFTGTEWIFHHFGPWSYEIDNFVKNLVKTKDIFTEKIQTHFENNKEINMYVNISGNVSRRDIWGKFNKIVMKRIFNDDLPFFKNDTYKLLDYVYFETEPMINAKPEDKLIFDHLEPYKQAVEINYKPLSKDNIKKMKEALRNFSNKNNSEKQELNIIDEDFIEFQNILHSEDEWDVDHVEGRFLIE